MWTYRHYLYIWPMYTKKSYGSSWAVGEYKAFWQFAAIALQHGVASSGSLRIDSFSKNFNQEKLFSFGLEKAAR